MTSKPKAENPEPRKNEHAKIDPETIDFVADLIREDHQQVPVGMVKWLAKMCIKENRIQDKGWIDNYVAKILLPKFDCDPVFTQFSKSQMQTFKDVFGAESIDFMQKHLDNPKHITPQWASHFMFAVHCIGVREVEKADSIYSYVLSRRSEWKEAGFARYLFGKVLKGRLTTAKRIRSRVCGDKNKDSNESVTKEVKQGTSQVLAKEGPKPFKGAANIPV